MDDDPIEAECTNESCVNTKNNLKMLMRTTQKQAADLKAYSQISAEADILRMKLYETEKTAQTATAQATEAINGKEVAEAELKQVQSSAEYYRKQIIQLQEEADEAHDHKQQANMWREKYDSICALAEKLESNNIDVKAKYESAVQMAKTLAKQLKPLQNQAAKAVATAEKNSNMRILNKYLKSAIQVIDALSTTANLAKQPKSVKDQVKVFRRDDVRLHFSSLPWKNSSGRDIPEDSEAADTSINDDADESEEPPQFESQDNLLQGGRTLSDDEDEVDDEEEEEEDDPEIQQLEKDLTEEVVRSTRKTRSQGAVRPDFGPKMRELNARKKAPRIVETKRVKNWPKPLQKPTIAGSAQSKHGLLDPRKIHAVHLPVTEFDAISKATEKRKEALLGPAGKPEDAPGTSAVASTSGTSIHGRKGKTVREQQSEMMKGESVKEKVARMKALELAKSGKAPNEKPSSSAVVDTFEPDVSFDPVESVNPVERTETEPPVETISKSPPPPSPPKKTPRMARHQSFCISEGTDSEDEGSRSRRTSVRTPSLRTRSRSVSRSSEAPRRSGRLATKPPTPVKQQPPPVTLRRSTRVASRPVSRAPSRAVSRRSSPSRGATPAAEPQDLIAQAVARNQRARTRSIMRGDGDDEDEDEQPDPKPEEEPKTSPVKRQRSRSRKDSESSDDEEEDLCLTSPFKPQQVVVVKEDTVGEVLKQRLQEKSVTAATLAIARKRAAPAPLDAGPPTRVKGVMGMAAPRKKTAPEVKESVHTETDSQDTDEVGEGSPNSGESPEFDEPTTSAAPTKRVAHAVKTTPDSLMVAPTKSPTKQVPQEPPKLQPTTSMLSEASSADEDLRIDDDDDDEKEEDRAPLEKPLEVVVNPVEAAPEAPELTKPSEPHLEPVKLPEPVKPVSSFHQTLSDLCIPPPASIRAPPTLKSPKQVIASQFGLDISDSEEEEEEKEEEPAPAPAPEAPKITEVPKEQPVAEKKKPEEKPVERDVDLFSEASFDSEHPDQLRIDETDDEQPSTSNVVETKKKGAEFAKPADPVAPKEKETARISKETAKEYSPVVDEEDVAAPKAAASPPKESPVAKPVAPKQAPPAIVPKIIIPPERKENLKPRRAPVRPIIPAPVRIPSSQDDTDDDLSLDILAGAKMSKPVPKKPPGTKRPAPPSAVPTTSAVASEPAPKRPAPAKPVARAPRTAATVTKKKDPVKPKPAESKDHEEPDVPEEPDTTDPTSSAPTAAGKKSGAILIDARPRGKPRKTDAAPKPMGIKELSVKKSAKALSTARGHLRQALDLKLDVTELKRPLEERGIVLGDSIPLHPSDATDVMMEFLRETSASDMWAVIKKQRSDGNLAPLMNTEEQNFLQVSVSLNSDHKLLLELFIGRILVELCRRDTLDSKQCGRYTRLFCHAVNFAEKDEEQSVEWMRRFVLILLNKHEHQLVKAVAYIMISDVAEHCRWLVEDIDEPSAFAMTFKVFMHLDSEQAAVLNWLLNSKFQYPYIPPPSTEDIKKTFLEAHQKFLTADDVTLEVMKPSIYLSKTGASIVLTVAFEKLKEQMTRLEKQFLEPHEKEKEMRHKTVFSIPSVSTKLTEEEAMAMKREMQWQKFVLMIMVDNQMSNHWKAILSALTEISPKIVDIRELIETPESEQFAEVSAIPAVREAVDQLSQLISEFTNFPLKTSTLATGDN